MLVIVAVTTTLPLVFNVQCSHFFVKLQNLLAFDVKMMYFVDIKKKGGFNMRVQVNLSEEMIERCDYYSKKMGVTRSSLCSMLIGQGIMSYDKSMDLLQLIGDKVGDSLLAEKTMQEVGKDVNKQ